MLFIKLFLALHITRSGQVSAFTPSCIRSRSFSGFRSLAHVAKMDDLLHQRKTCRSPPLKFTQSRARPASPLRASSSASLAASAGLGGSGLRFPWSPAAASAGAYILGCSLITVACSFDNMCLSCSFIFFGLLVSGERCSGTLSL